MLLIFFLSFDYSRSQASGLMSGILMMLLHVVSCLIFVSGLICSSIMDHCMIVIQMYLNVVINYSCHCKLAGSGSAINLPVVMCLLNCAIRSIMMLLPKLFIGNEQKEVGGLILLTTGGIIIHCL